MTISGRRIFVNRAYLLGIALLVLAGTSLGQEVNVGVKGGVSIPNLSGSDNNPVTKNYRSRTAVTFGGFVEFGVTDRLSVQPEINYSQQGGIRKGVQPITQPIPGLPTLPPGQYLYGDFKNTAKLNYLEVPVLLKYKFGSSGKPRFFLNGGVYYGYLLNATTVTKGSSTIYIDENKTPLLLPPLGTPVPPVSFDAKTDIINDVNRNNFGLTGGGGLLLPSGKNNNFIIDVRVSRGLTHVQKNTALNGESRTGNFVVSFGYVFGVKK